jgi:thymidylate synthase (FAD)
MKIVPQSVDILSISDNPLKTIEYAARNCYRSHDKIKNGSSEKIVETLVKNDHGAMIEFGSCVVLLKTNRSCLAELTRHRHCSFAVSSTRYINYKNDEIEFIKPVWWDSMSFYERDIFIESCKQSEFNYKTLIEHGQRPEQAREVLNHSLSTDIVMGVNFRELRHIFNLRCSKKAHPQIRSIMIDLLNKMKNIVPVIFDDINQED